MAMNRVSREVNLNRAHKVIARLTGIVNELEKQALTVDATVTVSTDGPGKRAVERKAAEAVTALAKRNEYFDLAQVLCDCRDKVAKMNLTGGVTSLLATQVMFTKKVAVLSRLHLSIAGVGYAIDGKELETRVKEHDANVLAKKGLAVTVNAPSVVVRAVTDEQVNAVKAELDAAKADVVLIGDQIAEANIRLRVELMLPEQYLAALLGTN